MAEAKNGRATKQYRRLLLQRRLKRAAEAEAFRQVAGSLRSAGARLTRMSPSSVREALGKLCSLPGRDERIDWPLVPFGNCQTWSDDAERNKLFRVALRACAKPDERVAVVWHTHQSGMRILVRDLDEHAASIFQAGSEIWICRADGSGRWLIEYARGDREICYGTAVVVEGD